MAEYRVSSLDALEYWGYKETLTGRVRVELGITAFGVNAWKGENTGDRVIPEHAEDQEGDQDELYVVVRGHARFEIDGETVDAPRGTLVYIPAGPTVRTAFAEEAGTTVLAVGGTKGKAFEDHGWEPWGRVHDLYAAGDYEGVVVQGRERIEAAGRPVPLYNLACCEVLAGRPAEDAIRHLHMAIDAQPSFRELARTDSDFDAIRDDPTFEELVGS
jgi:mannose-6-phosphate isomerase-like protein (cupin superfamily)